MGASLRIGAVECCCEDDDETPGAVKCGEFRGVTLKLFGKDSAHCNYLVSFLGR